MKRFEKNARVVFLGDSITSQDTWHSAIYQYYLDHFPNDNIRIYNAGMAGGSANGALRYKNDHLYRFAPTHVNIMFGMNDIGRNDYPAAPSSEQVERQKKSFAQYVRTMTALTEELLGKGITVSFCTPTPYDAAMDCAETCLPGCAPALERCSAFVRELCSQHACGYADFNCGMTKTNKDLQLKDKRLSLIGNDRVHPTAEGHMCMARLFLNAQGFTGVALPTVEMILANKDLALPIGDLIKAKNIPDASLRRILAIEYMLLLRYKDAPLEERFAAMKKFIKEQGATTIEYFKQGSVFYLENKEKQEDFFRESLRLSEEIHKHIRMR